MSHKSPMRRPTLLLMAALAACALAIPRLASALPAPDAATLAAWQGACDSSRAIRISTAKARFETARPKLDPTGVTFGHSGRAAFIVLGEPSASTRHVEWAGVERLDRSTGTESGRGFLMGGIVGGVLGGALVATYGPDIAESGDHGVASIAVLLGVTGALVGSLIGLGVTHWAPIAP